MIILVEYPGYAGDPVKNEINQQTLTTNAVAAMDSIKLDYGNLPTTIWVILSAQESLPMSVLKDMEII